MRLPHSFAPMLTWSLLTLSLAGCSREVPAPPPAAAPAAKAPESPGAAPALKREDPRKLLTKEVLGSKAEDDGDALPFGTGRSGEGSGALGSGEAVGIGGLGSRGMGQVLGGARGLGYSGSGSRDSRARGDGFSRFAENPFLGVQEAPLSTFSVDVDTASYAAARRFLREGQLPPRDAVRLEELINYFSYAYPAPRSEHPVALHVEAMPAPWKPENRLVRIALKSREVEREERPAANLVFLVDVSGSMEGPDRLPLVKRSLEMLVAGLEERDRVSLVVYAGASGLVLPPTRVSRRTHILEALERLEAGGPTHGAEGIELAYKTATQAFVKGGINRVILATDGDFNVGMNSEDELEALIERKAKSGVFLTVLGFGMGNLQDATLEKLADRGNGTYAYVDSLLEARRVLVEQLGGTLQTVAKDVKLQVEFNPRWVRAYRLLGYENRALAARDFSDDEKDAGDMGAGHTVTALYEVVPTGAAPGAQPPPEPLRYQQPVQPSTAAGSDELLTAKVRYKLPDGKESRLLSEALVQWGTPLARSSVDLRFAASVAAFGMLLRDSPHRGNASFDMVAQLAKPGLKDDALGYRHEFLSLVRQAKALAAEQAVVRTRSE
jgi:Ca-activated chloride channel homolog